MEETKTQETKELRQVVCYVCGALNLVEVETHEFTCERCDHEVNAKKCARWHGERWEGLPPLNPRIERSAH